jgi:hypothetical protein
MLTHNLDIRVFQTLFTDARFASLLATVDRLHDVVSEGKLDQVTNLSKDEVVGWLNDILFTVQETINELENPSQLDPYMGDCESTLIGGYDA